MLEQISLYDFTTPALPAVTLDSRSIIHSPVSLYTQFVVNTYMFANIWLNLQLPYGANTHANGAAW